MVLSTCLCNASERLDIDEIRETHRGCGSDRNALFVILSTADGLFFVILLFL